ncbi:MAG TPA: hypothetical protein VHT28_07600 [Silvibacterium sp.]|nr:hypothetical protein [Silvibacterium sp.]
MRSRPAYGALEVAALEEPVTAKTSGPAEPAPVVLVTSVVSTEAKPPSPVYAHPPEYLNVALADAERLLKHAAETGIAIDDATRDHVLEARTASTAGWTEQTAANLLSALTTLAARLKPVTAASLKATYEETVHTVRSYLRVAIWLAVFIVPFSVASFVATALSNAIRADIVTANALAVQLRSQLGPPKTPPAPLPTGLNEADVITQLQLYASTVRAIDARARQLNFLIFNFERDPFAYARKDPAKLHEIFQLPPDLSDLAKAADDRTIRYQDVRYFAQNVLDTVSIFYGAITACILPVMYALLGTCAYLLRTFEQQMSTRTFTPSDANFARFLIAAIGGAVVGLFNNFTLTQGASIPPLAFAFLVGYAVDVFFSFLEGLLQSFTRNTPASPPAPPSEARQA